MKPRIITYILLVMTAMYMPGGWSTLGFVVQAAAQSPLQNFDGTGVLHDIRSGSVIINDIYHRLAPDVEFKSPGTEGVDPASFQRGDSVGFYKDGEGRIAELWRYVRQKNPLD